MATIDVTNFAGQNWVITPAAQAVKPAVDLPPVNTILDQMWHVVLTGVGIVELPGDGANSWRRETLAIHPDLTAALNSAVVRYQFPAPPGSPFFYVLDLDQWAPHAAVSSVSEQSTTGSDIGFAVDVWRPVHFVPVQDFTGRTLNRVFRGIEVDISVRNDGSILHRVSYHITLLGKIVVIP